MLLIALLISVTLGILVGLVGVRLHPPGVRGWLTAFSIVGLSTPSFFIGRLAIALLFLLLIYSPVQTPLLPMQGFGWDWHLVLPVFRIFERTLVVDMIISLYNRRCTYFVRRERGKSKNYLPFGTR